MVSIRKLGRADYLLLPLFLLLAVLGLWLVDSRLRVERQLATLAVERASQSSTITQQLGVPLKTGYLITGNLAMTCCDMGTADLRIPVSGPNGRGTFIEWSQFGYAGWHICSLVFRPKTGSDITVVPDETSTCERE